MADLHPTKTRLALLQDVADSRVRGEHGDVIAIAEDGKRRTVTAATEDMCLAGWVRPGEVRACRRQYEITDAGRAVLDRAGAR